MNCPRRLALPFVLTAILAVSENARAADEKPPAEQYRHGDIVVPAATADEPVRMELSLQHASDYLERGAVAWTKSRNCVSCHTNGAYQQVRPALTPWLGRPSERCARFSSSRCRLTRTRNTTC